MIRRAFYRDAFIAVGDLLLFSSACCNVSLAYLVVVNPVVGTNSINAIVATKISTSNREMINLHVEREVNYDVELRTVDKDKIMNTGVDWLNQPDQTWSNRALIVSIISS